MIFIDTGAFYALKIEDDLNHASAIEIEKKIRQGLYGKIITTNYIIDELTTLLLKELAHNDIVNIMEKIRYSKNILIAWISEEIEELAWEYFKMHQDKEYSFTDCSSFVVMSTLNINTAFTYDKHFMQAGFLSIPDK